MKPTDQDSVVRGPWPDRRRSTHFGPMDGTAYPSVVAAALDHGWRRRQPRRKALARLVRRLAARLWGTRP